eukprot:7768314-Ditylum_brightwellii.AAC.1
MHHPAGNGFSSSDAIQAASQVAHTSAQRTTPVQDLCNRNAIFLENGTWRNQLCTALCWDRIKID